MLPLRIPSVALLAVAVLSPLPAAAVKCPNMYVLQDRSGSMGSTIGGQTKWQIATGAVQTFTSAVVSGTPRQEFMRFGLAFFPTDTNCATGPEVVAPNYYTASAIQTAMSGRTPNGNTPMGEAVRTAAAYAGLNDATRPRYVILLTDGTPTCTLTAAQATSQVASLLSKGVKTFVIGFDATGSGVDPDALDDMATAGGTARVGAARKYYNATDGASLSAAFDAIALVAQGELGTATCDDSCYGNPCPAGQRCEQKIVTFGSAKMNLGQCVTDPCAGKTCGTDQFCRDGQCIGACTTACESPKICIDGTCQNDPCAGGTCACSGGCAKNLVCLNGTCADDPCRYVVCPTGAPVCVRGNCMPAPVIPVVDAGGGGSDGGDPGSVNQGCSCGATGAATSLLALCGVALAGLSRRRRQ